MTHALLLVDASFAHREHRLLNRLNVGLSDEGARVTIATPWRVDSLRSWSLSDSVEYDPPAPLVTASMRAARLVDAIDRRVGPAHRPGVVHAWGDGCWRLALETARALNASLVVEVWAARLVRRVPALHRAARRRLGEDRVLFSTPSRAIRSALAQTRAAEQTRLVHWGVYAPSQLRRRDAGKAPSLAILATGDDPDGAQRALEGLAPLAREQTDLLTLLDDRAVRRRPALWRFVREAGLLESLTLVADMEEQRETVLAADVLVQPEATGEVRSITLEALAAGMVVVAEQDPTSDTLREESPALVLRDAAPSEWERALRAALDDAVRGGRHAAAGLTFVRSSRRASDQVAETLRLYEAAMSAATPP